MSRIILLIIDGFGVGELPDAKEYGDEGSNTLLGIYNNTEINLPNLEKLGLYHITNGKIETNIEQTLRCVW